MGPGLFKCEWGCQIELPPIHSLHLQGHLLERWRSASLGAHLFYRYICVPLNMCGGRSCSLNTFMEGFSIKINTGNGFTLCFLFLFLSSLFIYFPSFFFLFSASFFLYFIFHFTFVPHIFLVFALSCFVTRSHDNRKFQ